MLKLAIKKMLERIYLSISSVSMVHLEQVNVGWNCVAGKGIIVRLLEIATLYKKFHDILSFHCKKKKSQVKYIIFVFVIDTIWYLQQNSC